MQSDPHASSKMVFLGIGAIGGSAGAWVSAVHPHTFLLARGETAAALCSGGLTLFTARAPEQKEPVRVCSLDDGWLRRPERGPPQPISMVVYP